MLGRVAMALVGDVVRAGSVLEEVAREAAARPPSEMELVTLLGLVRAACAVHLSKLPLRKHGGAPTSVGHASAPDGDSAAVAARSAIAALRPTEREALVLSLVGGLSARDVARACNVDESTARARLERALQELEKIDPIRTVESAGDSQ